MNISKTHHQPFSAFTLVELIVVIAVLAVLAAISFSAVANVTSGARDSARLTDISSIKTALETYSATKGGYPLPDNAVAISWSGNLAWSQGTFGDNTTRALNVISRPKDPKWGVDYTYSVSNTKKEYEIATVLEKAASFNGVEKAYAQGEQYDTIIKGNYNGVALRVSSPISTWILAVPTLIASDIKDAKMENVVFSYSKSKNLPFSYTGSITSPQTAPTPWTPKQVWSGATNSPTTLPKTDTELQTLTTDLKAAYTGSPAANSETIKSLLTTTDTKSYANNVVNNVNGLTNPQTINTPSIYSWSVSIFWSCSASCGNGIQTRIVTCLKNDGTTVIDNYCATPKPDTNQACNTQSCTEIVWQLNEAWYTVDPNKACWWCANNSPSLWTCTVGQNVNTSVGIRNCYNFNNSTYPWSWYTAGELWCGISPVYCHAFTRNPCWWDRWESFKTCS